MDAVSNQDLPKPQRISTSEAPHPTMSIYRQTGISAMSLQRARAQYQSEMPPTMENAIEFYATSDPSCYLPNYTRKASILHFAVLGNSFGEEQFFRCTFSIAVEAGNVFGPLVLSVDEGTDHIASLLTGLSWAGESSLCPKALLTYFFV